MNNEVRNRSFVAEALVISVSNLLVKLIGVLFKIPMSNMLQESMGIFNAAYSIYAMLYMVSTAGLPVAISRMVAASDKLGRKRETERIYKVGSLLFGAVGLICSLVLFFGAEAIAVYSEHADAALAMKVISPTLFLVCAASAIRGYFQGLRNMLPTAVSQFIEAFFKLVIGIIGAYIAMKSGQSPVVQAAFGISGLTFGTFLSALFLFICRKKYVSKLTPEAVPHPCRSTRSVARSLAAVAIPVTITSSALYFSQFLDTLVINKCLISSGLSAGVAEQLYASYTTLAVSLSDLLPSTLVYPIAISILPAVSAAISAHDEKGANTYIRNSVRISTIIGMPCAFGLMAVAKQAISLIYGSSWGKEIVLPSGTFTPVEIASSALRILALGIIFISLLSTTNALLQAVGSPYLPMISVGVGVVFLVAVEIAFVSMPSVGIYGAPAASVVCYLAALILNMYFLRKKRGFNISPVRLFLKPFVCALLCGVTAYAVTLLFDLLPSSGSRLVSGLSLAVAGISGAAVYAVSMLACRGISKNEILLLPKGEKILSLLTKTGLYR